MTAPLGATAQEWAAWEALGLTADLLPVVSDPSVPISPKSKLKELGKVPSIINSAGHVAGLNEWTKHHATPADIARWSADDRLGICLIGRRVKAIDIDIPDGTQAEIARSVFEVMLGELPMRYRANSGKCLLAFRLDGELPKRKFSTAGGAIELLGDRQQFIVAGTHPSGARYHWGTIGPHHIPEVTLDQLDAAWAAAEAALGLPGTSTSDRRAGGQERPRTADDADDPAVPYLEGAGWVRGYSDDGRVFVVCPWQHEHTDAAAGADSATIYYPAGVGAAQRGWKCLHAHCAGRTHFDFLRAVGWEAEEVAAEFPLVVTTERAAPATEEYPGQRGVPEWGPEGEWPTLQRDKNGNTLPTLQNVLAALGCPDCCQARIGFDEFKASIMVEWADERGAWRPFRDTDYTRLRAVLERRGFARLGAEVLRECVARAAEVQSFDSAVQWVAGLQWDGVPRVERFFVDCFGVADSDYARAVGRYTWTALAGRALVPGVKADMVPVLIGAQGLRKTTGVEAMCPTPDAFVELSLDIHDDNLARKMRGKLVAELGELRGLAGKDAEAIRQWISRREEEWTPKYREFTVRFPRRLVMIGTGNNPEFLEDDGTGHRRWLPMTVERMVDTDRIARERDQLWAEGRSLFCAGGHAVEWGAAQQLATAHHDAYTSGDDWEEPITRWLEEDGMGDSGEGAGQARGLQPFTTSDVLAGALAVPVAKMDRRSSIRAAKLLRGLGYRQLAVRESGYVQKRWARSKL